MKTDSASGARIGARFRAQKTAAAHAASAAAPAAIIQPSQRRPMRTSPSPYPGSASDKCAAPAR